MDWEIKMHPAAGCSVYRVAHSTGISESSSSVQRWIYAKNI
jgi:hypothetical protein